MIPSRRLLLCLGCLLPVTVLGVVQPTVLGFVLGADLLLVVLAILDAWRASKVPLEVRRSWPRLVVQDQPEVLELEITGPTGTRIALRETLHPSLATQPFRIELLLRSRDPQRVGPPADPEVARVARTEARVAVPLRASRRGRHTAGPLSLRVLGPWGLAWHQRLGLEGEVVKVYPRVRWGGRVGQLLALARRRELGAVPLKRQGIGGELYSLRPYREGDLRNRIHWRASAKRGNLVVREDTLERGAPLVLLFDCGRPMTSAAGHLGKLDYALAAGLALLRVASSRGDKVRVAAFSDRLERQLQVRSGEAGVRQAYEQLYDLEARLVEPVYDIAGDWVRTSAPGRATVVLFTSVVDLVSADLLRSALHAISRRHRVLLINLEDPVIRALAEEPPTTAPEVFAKLYSLDILLHNRKLAAQLRRRGIVTVSAPADRLALATLESYFALLAEGLAA